jgi:mono/diheme cytochrome c family protein
MQNARVLRSLIVSAIFATFLFVLGRPLGAVGTEPPVFAGAGSDATALFGAKCAVCHGKDGRGLEKWRAKGQPDFTDMKWQKSRKDPQLAESIRNGKNKFMPGWKDKLSDEEISGLVIQIRAFGKKLH